MFSFGISRETGNLPAFCPHPHLPWPMLLHRSNLPSVCHMLTNGSRARQRMLYDRSSYVSCGFALLTFDVYVVALVHALTLTVFAAYFVDASV